jgi:hypothetical protein
VLGSDNETGPSAGKERLFASRPPTQLQTSTTTLAAALGGPPSFHSDSNSCKSIVHHAFLQQLLASQNQGKKLHPNWISGYELVEGCTYDLISLQRIRLHRCTAHAISLRLQVPH